MDTMILQYLYDNIGMEGFNRILMDNNYELEILISWVNVFEKIRGIKEKHHFIKNQKIIKMVLDTPNVVFLANPKAHIKMRFDNNEWNIHAEILKNMLYDFRDNNDPDLFKKKWGDWFSKANADLIRIKKSYDEMAKQVAEILNNKSDTYNDKIYESLKPHLITEFSLPYSYRDSDPELLYKDFPSIKYYAELFVDFAIGLGRTIYRRNVGNYLDNSQVLYLDIADYFISNDNNLILRMKNIPSKALINRVFTLKEFMSIEHSEIRHCSPHAVYDYY